MPLDVVDEHEENGKFHALFSTVLGQEVLAILKADYVEIFPFQPGTKQDVNDTIFFLGQQSAIASIPERMRHYEEHLKTPKPKKRTEGDYI